MDKLVSPCGLDCFNCKFYDSNITNDTKEEIAYIFKLDPTNVTCFGCQGDHYCLQFELTGTKCKTLDCVSKHKVEYCSQCGDFPCDMLMPVADEAEKYPHNIKLYNLCIIKEKGMDYFVKIANNNRKMYYFSKFRIGEGGTTLEREKNSDE